jgi:hypothetical protein
MKITKVTYQKAFQIGPFLQERIGVEIDLEESDDPNQAFQLAKEMTEDFHKQANPHLEGTTIANVSGIQPERFDETQEIQAGRSTDAKTALIQDIMSCKEVKVLESYKLLVKSQPELQVAYDKRMEELLNQLIK